MLTAQLEKQLKRKMPIVEMKREFSSFKLKLTTFGLLLSVVCASAGVGGGGENESSFIPNAKK